MTEVDDIELARRLRQNLLDVLELWTSKEQQLEYQANVPIAQVTAELICQWADDYYYPETKHFKLAFDENERTVLADFDKVLNNIVDNIPAPLPSLNDFINTNDWLVISQAAIATLTKLNNTAANKGDKQ
jgi:uncharacterized protein YbaR (Trm112 family)